MTKHARLTRIVIADRTNRLSRVYGCGLGARYVSIGSVVSCIPDGASILRDWYPPGGLRNVTIELDTKG